MPSPPKLRPDVNEIAFRTVQAATGQGEKPQAPGAGEPNPLAAQRGRQGGKRGGRARARKLSKGKRRAIAKRAAAARWKTEDKGSTSTYKRHLPDTSLIFLSLTHGTCGFVGLG